MNTETISSDDENVPIPEVQHLRFSDPTAMETETDEGEEADDTDEINDTGEVENVEEVELNRRPVKKRRRSPEGIKLSGVSSPLGKKNMAVVRRNAIAFAKELRDLREMVKTQADSILNQSTEIKRLKRKKTSGNSSSGGAPKALNNPQFPETLRFDLEKADQSDIDAFIQEFEDVTDLVDRKYILATLRLRLSKDVRTQLRHHNDKRVSSGKSAMSYKETIKWLRVTFQARDAHDQLFHQFTAIKQGKLPMRSYLAKFHSKLHQLEARNIKLNKYTRRKFMLDGIKERVRSKALEMPEYYSMPYDDLLKKLSALDEALTTNTVATVAAVSSKKLESMVAAAVKKQYSGDKTFQRSTRDTRFSTKTMKPLYSEEQWEARLAAVKSRAKPSANAHLFNKDCYPVEDGKPGNGAQKACVFCRKLGHTIAECTKCK